MDFDNELIDPIKYALNEDMEKPISNYFINSRYFQRNFFLFKIHAENFNFLPLATTLT